ncbi:hypothetical protein [Brevibacterium oceani]|uniref:hypothetical protein n=1 Tax=Brevibacterium oceani TaxID=358099 RepID=UPI0015E68297|nr:hypothetical protein [Brevibacterium oceani]
MRIIVAYEQRESDEFEIQALAMAMARSPHLTNEDYEAGIVDYHSQPQQRRMKAGDVLHAAKSRFNRRSDSHGLEAGPTNAVPRPANYKQMVMGYTRIVREFKEQGIINPSNDELIREYDRRVKENTK